MLLNPTFTKLNKLPLLMALFSLLLYWVFAYNLVRTDYIKLIVLYSILFILFFFITKNIKHNTKALTVLAFGFRAVFILAIPNLSQDFYRFIWDGRMILEGINPYLHTVDYFINIGEFPIAQTLELRDGMGNLNASHFTNYPPINQLCFAIAAVFASKSILGSIVTMRLLIIAADFGTLYYGTKLLVKLKLPTHNIFWYILNPFIIIELTGNLHFEGIMIFFLVWSMYLLYSNKWMLSAIVFALSVATKLIPLIFLPLFFQWFIKRNTIENEVTSASKYKNSLSQNNIKKRAIQLISFYCLVIITTLLLFTPFYSSEFINNYSKTVALWFGNFEFNASFYYIARDIGYLFRGYNEITIISKATSILVICFVIILSFFRKNKTMIELKTAMLIALSFYYFTATTVHPWYIAMLLILSVFTKYKFPLVWSFVIILSYLAYVNVNTIDKSENLWIIGLEYLIVFGVFIWEVCIKKASKTLEA